MQMSAIQQLPWHIIFLDTMEYVSIGRKLKIRRFLEIEKTARGEVDVELIHEHGCTFDTSGLPHHISDHEEIDCYLSEFTEIFSRLKSKLKFITIARFVILLVINLLPGFFYLFRKLKFPFTG